MRRTVRVTIAALAVAVAVVVPALPASAALSSAPVASVAVTADPPDFTPSSGKWRKWMINTLSSVLGAASPKAWKAEQIANAHQFNAGAWDMMNAQLGIDGVRTNSAGQMVGIKYTNRGQGTYTDVVIDGMEEQFRTTGKTGGTGGKPMTAAATKPMKFTKTVGGALVAFTGFEIGNMLGAASVSGIGGMFGWDVAGTVCSQLGDDLVGGALTLLSGQDCDMWRADLAYAWNSDAPADVGGQHCYEGFCVIVTGDVRGQVSSSNSARIIGFCVAYSGVAPSGVTYTLTRPSGQTDSSAAWYNAKWPCPAGSATAGNPWREPFLAASPGIRFTKNGSTVSSVPAGSLVKPSDPERRLDCTVRYVDGTSITTSGALYRESGGAIQPPTCAATPPGKTPDSVSVTDVQTGGGPSQKISDQPVTPEFQDWWQNYPECQTGACRLELFKGGASTVPASCFDLEDGCRGWAEDPAKASIYTCRYGVHAVDLSECNVYAGLFEPGRIESGAAYTDPTTGTWSGGQTSPKSGTQAMGAQIQDPESLRTCDFSGLGFDPVGWVLKPIQCGMEWAFAPRPTVVEAKFAGAGSAWDGKPPQVIGAFVGGIALTPSASGCSRTATLFGVTFPVLDNCPGSPMATITGISRLVTGVAMAYLVIIVLRRQIAGMVGYNQGQ